LNRFVRRQARMLSPKSADLHYALGLLQAREGRYSKAVAELGKASSLAPDNLSEAIGPACQKRKFTPMAGPSKLTFCRSSFSFMS
jgi:hypothetical protein